MSGGSSGVYLRSCCLETSFASLLMHGSHGVFLLEEYLMKSTCWCNSLEMSTWTTPAACRAEFHGFPMCDKQRQAAILQRNSSWRGFALQKRETIGVSCRNLHTSDIVVVMRSRQPLDGPWQGPVGEGKASGKKRDVSSYVSSFLYLFVSFCIFSFCMFLSPCCSELGRGILPPPSKSRNQSCSLNRVSSLFSDNECSCKSH